MAKVKNTSKRRRPKKEKTETKPMDKSVVIKKTKSETNSKKTSSVQTIKTSKRLQLKAGTNDSTVESDSDGDTDMSSVAKTDSAVGKRGRKASNPSTDSQLFTQREKKAFYECLSENGFNVINNEKVLLKVFPNRSITEIKALIDSYSRKAQELNRKSDETVDSEPNSSKNPIEKWFDLIHQLVPNNSKKDDISAMFADVFDELKGLANVESQPEETEDGEPELIADYDKIYDCIRDSLNGKFAQQLRPIDAFVVVKLIEELKQLLVNDEYEKESEFLSSGQWWKPCDQRSNADELRSVYLQRQQQNAIESIGKDMAQNGKTSRESNESTTGVEPSKTGATEELDTIDTNFEALLNYPKLRKIAECFNPLKVAIDLTQSQFNRWQ